MNLVILCEVNKREIFNEFFDNFGLRGLVGLKEVEEELPSYLFDPAEPFTKDVLMGAYPDDRELLNSFLDFIREHQESLGRFDLMVNERNQEGFGKYYI